MELPTYDVEFIPLERRLNERRTVATKMKRPPYLGVDHRGACGRRPEDQRACL